MYLSTHSLSLLLSRHFLAGWSETRNRHGSVTVPHLDYCTALWEIYAGVVSSASIL